MIGLVLAAGAGRRLRPYTDTLPKALVPVDGEVTILDIALRNFAAVDMRDVAVVVGYAAEAVHDRKQALENAYGVRLTLVHNDKAEIWNNAYSLWTAREVMADGALLVNGDTVHPVSVEETLLAARGSGGGARHGPGPRRHQEAGRRGDEGPAVGGRPAAPHHEADGPGDRPRRVHRRHPHRGGAVPALADALEATFTRDPDLYYEDGYQEMVDRGLSISTAPLAADTSWVEVDDHVDLARAREIACRY